jgi:hypothetical protein
MKKQFMLDIETTGVDPKTDDVLQIAIVEMSYTPEGYWEIGRQLNFFQNTKRQPENSFAREQMADLFAHCQQQPLVAVPDARQKILDFFKLCGAKSPHVYICGWHVGIFDLPFLAHHGYLNPARYEEGKLVGDCHYRVYDIGGVLQFVANLRGKSEINPLINETLSLFPVPQPGSRHDALFDCLRQVQVLNGLIKIVKEQIPAP